MERQEVAKKNCTPPPKKKPHCLKSAGANHSQGVLVLLQASEACGGNAQALYVSWF